MIYYSPAVCQDVSADGVRERGDSSTSGARFGGGHWNATGTPPSLGELRLLRLRDLAGTGRTTRLRPATVELALRAFRAFSLVAQNAPQPRVAPSDDGAIGLEWEMGGRELFLEVLPDGSNEWLQVESDRENPPVMNGDPERFAAWLIRRS